jgi:adenylate cyclase
MAGERKLATVLCWRLEWSAAPDGDDPEAHYTRLQAFVELTTPEIHRYGGTVQHVLPDGVLALFGVPQTQEDHAQRAVLAALGVQRRVAAFPSTPPLELRTGMHTGLVVGQLGTDMPNPYVAGEIAAGATHLAQTAAAGAIVVSATTARLARLLVQLTAVAPPPGTTTLGPCYQVQGLRPQRTPNPWGDERPLTPLVGRKRELGVLQRVFEQVVAGQGQVVGLVGEPAIGKSRLLYEFRYSLQGQLVTYLTGRCLAYGSTTPYLPVLDMLRQNCGLTETDPPDVVRAKMAQSLREVALAPEDWAAPVLELLGVDPGPPVLTPQARK